MSDPLDLFIEELLDIARENPIDDARLIIRDRLIKDAERAISQSLFNGVTKELRGKLRYCSIHKLEYFADCPQCEYDADLADTPHPSEYYEQPERDWGTYAEDFDYDDG